MVAYLLGDQKVFSMEEVIPYSQNTFAAAIEDRNWRVRALSHLLCGAPGRGCEVTSRKEIAE
jgi:hypothetical protein